MGVTATYSRGRDVPLKVRILKLKIENKVLRNEVSESQELTAHLYKIFWSIQAEGLATQQI
jgi:hypothetical protein